MKLSIAVRLLESEGMSFSEVIQELPGILEASRYIDTLVHQCPEEAGLLDQDLF